jgi:serine/threonine-protein kinase
MLGNTTMPMGMLEGRVLPLTRPARRQGSRYGDYDVVAPLAKGGMGGVYLAAHVVTGHRVALKVLDPAFAGHGDVVQRLYAEHAIANRTRHPSVVEIHTAEVTADNIPYLVMEYLEGMTLAAIGAAETLGLSTIMAIGAQVAAALAALHSVGVIHCDVKPDNIFVLDARNAANWPKVKILDFGVSRLVDEPPPSPDAIAGTPWCMAPEQWRGQPCTASDVYALGCVLFDLATGCAPFDGSLTELMQAHLEIRPSRPSWLRPMSMDLERLILRCLAKQPGERPTMQEIARDLAAMAYEPELRAAG